MSLVVFFGMCLLISGVTIRFSIALAGRFGIMDHPGGHKQHDTSTPFVGGVGVMTALIVALYLAGLFFNLPSASLVQMRTIAVGAVVIFLTGLVDDIWNLGFKVRFLAQSVAALFMVFMGGVVLSDLGELLPGVSLALGLLAIPFTVFATIGVINAVNMIDGIDGLSGALSLVSLILMAVVAYLAGQESHFILIVALMGGVLGFLYYNLRYPANRRARVFLGDNGSMLLGFVFAWILIDLSQGVDRAMTPVTALWIFALPLMDTVGVMLRRIWLGKSPFRADRNHLHHLFLRAGFRVSDTVYIIVGIQLVLGAVGITGMLLGIPDYMMFGFYLITFAVYFYVVARPWRFVPTLRKLHAYLGLPSALAQGIFIGYVPRASAQIFLHALTRALGRHHDYHLSLHEMNHETRGGRSVYAVLDMHCSDDDVSLNGVKRLISVLRKRLANQEGIQIRQFVRRRPETETATDTLFDKDRRAGYASLEDNSPGIDRRYQQNKTLIYPTVKSPEIGSSGVPV